MSAPTFARAVRDHRQSVVDFEPEVRRGADPEAVHKQRVATRRLRSLLRSTGPQSDDPEKAARLRNELRWLGAALGEVRDRDVLIANLQSELATVDEASSFRGVLKLLDGEREQAREKLLTAFEAPRYRRLLDELETPPALRDGELETAAAKEHRKLRKAVKRLGDEPSDEQLHELRIRVKRARYAAEAAGVGKKYVECAKTLQDILGEHQDAVFAEARIRRLVSRARASRRTSFAAGRLIERQRNRRVVAREAWGKAWKELKRAGDTGWS